MVSSSMVQLSPIQRAGSNLSFGGGVQLETGNIQIPRGIL